MNHVLSSRIMYPGLFQPSGIEFDLPEDAVVTVTITNDDGVVYAMPVNQQKYDRGTHEVVFSLPSKNNSGLFYTIVAEMAIETVRERRKLS